MSDEIEVPGIEPDPALVERLIETARGDDADAAAAAVAELAGLGFELVPDESPTAGAVFDVETFVKQLPDGVGLCPLCLGIGATIDSPPPDPTVHLCQTCQGWGKLRLPSSVGGQAQRECHDCGGLGWQPNEPGSPPARPAAAADFAGPQPPVDHLGRTPDDPEFAWDRVVTQPAAGEPQQAAEPVPAV